MEWWQQDPRRHQFLLLRLLGISKVILPVLLFVAAASAQLNLVNLKTAGTALGRADCVPMADITGCLNAVLGQNPGQTIAIDPGTYSITGVVNIGQDQKVIGAGSNGPTALFLQGAGELAFGTSTNAGNGGLLHLQITSNNAPIGIQVNGHNLHFEDVLFGGFGTAVQFGGNSFENTFIADLFEVNDTALSAPIGSSGGERMVISNCEFTGNGTDINDQVGFEWMINTSSFDQTKNLSIAINGTVSAQPGHLRINHSHFEPTSQLPSNGFIFNSAGPVTINVQDSTFLTNATTGTNPAFIVVSPQAQVNVTGGFASSQVPVCLARGGQSVWFQGMASDGNISVDPTSCGLPAAAHRKISNMFGGPDVSALW